MAPFAPSRSDEGWKTVIAQLPAVTERLAHRQVVIGVRWPNVKVHGAATLLRSTPAEAYDELERTSHPRFACRERLVEGAADVHHAAAQPLVGLHEQAPLARSVSVAQPA